MTMTRLLCAVLIVAISSPAAAISYLDFERAPLVWKQGYVHGLLDHIATFYWNEDMKRHVMARQECYARMGKSSEQLVRLIAQYAAAKPRLQQSLAAHVIVEYLEEACRPN
ncbi:MAG: hypothetical protein IT536_15360 [Hyphomicrobiales bacterium]|nr:hypothetical protein [Hyphomicrobiales bacterium]